MQECPGVGDTDLPPCSTRSSAGAGVSKTVLPGAPSSAPPHPTDHASRASHHDHGRQCRRRDPALRTNPQMPRRRSLVVGQPPFADVALDVLLPPRRAGTREVVLLALDDLVELVARRAPLDVVEEAA